MPPRISKNGRPWNIAVFYVWGVPRNTFVHKEAFKKNEFLCGLHRHIKDNDNGAITKRRTKLIAATKQDEPHKNSLGWCTRYRKRESRRCIERGIVRVQGRASADALFYVASVLPLDVSARALQLKVDSTEPSYLLRRTLEEMSPNKVASMVVLP